MKHARTQCAACHQTFAGTKAFDAHRVGPFTRQRKSRRCLSLREMRLRGMTQTEQGLWALPAPTQPKEGADPD